MNSLFYITIAIMIGASLALQPPINVVMARTLGSPLLAASISISISFIFVLLIWLTWGKGAGDLTQVKVLPWWIVVGGIIGVAVVAGSIVVAPVLGIALFFICIVAGQLLGSTLIDQFGAFGVEVKPINVKKLLGISLVLVGAVLVQSSNT